MSWKSYARPGLGGAGDTAGHGADVMNGGDGTDTFQSSDTVNDGADTIDGAGGGGLVTYASRTVPVSITFDGVANDGAAGENDTLLRINQVSGGAAGDTMTGDSRRHGDAERARRYADEAVALAAATGYRVLEGQALVSLANAVLDLGRNREAAGLAARAVDPQRDTGYRLGALNALVALGHALARSDRDGARTH